MTDSAAIVRLAMEGDMTIYNATEQKHRLMASLDSCQELELDLGQVSEIDTAGFQLLILAKREALRHQKVLRIVAHSTPVSDLLDFYNKVAYFGDPVHLPARD